MKQAAEDHGIAIQSGRDTVINTGVTAEQMTLILNELSKLLPTYVAIARDLVDQRMEEFRKQVLKKFTTPAADPNAFKSPDFQYVLTRAQNAYARSGDPDLAGNLVDMIAERSLQTDRSRLTLALNAAIETAAELTPEEFAELSIVFLVRYTRHRSLRSLADFKAYFEQSIQPFLSLVSKEPSSYQYLESKQCAFSEIVQVDLYTLMKNSYAGLFQRGFTADELANALPQEHQHIVNDRAVVIDCMNDPTMLQFNALDDDILRGILGNVTLPSECVSLNRPGFEDI